MQRLAPAQQLVLEQRFLVRTLSLEPWATPKGLLDLTRLVDLNWLLYLNLLDQGWLLCQRLAQVSGQGC